MENQTTEGAANTRRDVLLPAAIIIAGVLIAGSVIWSVGKKAEGPAPDAARPNAPAGPNVAAMRAVDASDHVRGPREAKVVVVEYSDFECPYCKRFHDTMKSVLATYGNDVAWVYRHYPIAALHAKAAEESEASECAAELGGNEAFWKFSDRIFELTPSNDGLNLAELPNIAEFAGVARAPFESCRASGRHAGAVAASVSEAEGFGVRGTPYVVFVARDGFDADDLGFLAAVNAEFSAQVVNQPPPFAIDERNGRIGMSGAFPLEMVKQIVDALLK